MKEKKLCIIVPAYNEAESIEKVINNIITNYSCYDYVIVNDGSTDNTADICRNKGYNIIDLPVNLGLTGAFQTGLKWALKQEYEYVIQLDGDGQHDPRYIEGMLELADSENLDIVIGSRFVGEKKPFSLRMFGSKIIDLIIRIKSGKRLSDPTSGMRLFNRKVVKVMSHDINMGPEPDTVAYLIKCGAKVKEYKVEMSDRETGESYLNLSNSIKYMWKMCFSILIFQNFRERKKI
ncbi:MAG: glycosyltransferase family 2 protein [Lachnospiraceae bacterium]|nr:glycosyltransferase family 2 protein [Lachnospiraceae bacterium]